MTFKNFQKISNFFNEIIPENLKQKRFIYDNIFNNWKQIVGDDISLIAIPLHLKFYKKNSSEATLTIEVHQILAHEVQLLSDNIKERINSFYGFDVINKIKLKKTDNINLLKNE